ncbi:MAG: cell division ATP-binding protein FtsE [Fibrobacterota bacterium]
MIEFSDVTKTYGGWKVLDSVSFSAEKGEFIFISGPSGSGKSTILRHIYGELLPDSGEVKIFGVNTSSMNPAKEVPKLRQKIGIVFQGQRLLSGRSVFENTALPLRIGGYKEKQIKIKVLKTLADVGLSHKSTAYPEELSGGEAQRVCIARAVINDPVVLLADEPTGNLDSENEQSIFDIIRRINRKGALVIMATHSTSLIDSSAYREIRLNRGLIV